MVQVPDHIPPKDCVVEEIILVTTGPDTYEYVWASLDRYIDDSSDSCVFYSQVISKTNLVPINIVFNNLSVAQTSMSSCNSRKKPVLNWKDVVDPKAEAKNSLN